MEEKEATELRSGNSSVTKPKRGSSRTSSTVDDGCCPDHAADVRTLGAPRTGCAWLKQSFIERKKTEYEKQNGLAKGKAVNGVHIHIPECCFDCKGRIPSAFGLSVKEANKICEEEMEGDDGVEGRV